MTVIHEPFDAPIGTSTTDATHPLDDEVVRHQRCVRVIGAGAGRR
jgi:hypothetical protein